MKNLALMIALLTVCVGCAKDPSKGVPKAQVIAEPAAQEVVKKNTAAKESQTEKAAAGATPVIIELTGKIRFIGSKVTGSHYCDLTRSGGALTLNGDDLTQAAFSFEAETSAIHCDADSRDDWTPKLEEHLVSEDFFWSEKHPKASFKSTAIVANAKGGATHQVTGDLSLRGITRKVTFLATLAADAKGVSGRTEFSINRKDFGIEYAGKADNLVRDNVVLKVSLSGTR